MADAEITINGLDKLLSKLNGMERQVIDPEIRTFLTTATGIIAREAQQRAPKDTGGLANDFTTSVSGYTGHILNYNRAARPMEYGTGLLSEAPDSKHSRHFPPPAALDDWAQRHGFPNGFIVARAIYRRGGLAPRKFLRGAVESKRQRVTAEFRKMANRMIAWWGKQ